MTTEGKVQALLGLMLFHTTEAVRKHNKNVEYLATIFPHSEIQEHLDEAKRAREELQSIAYGR